MSLLSHEKKAKQVNTTQKFKFYYEPHKHFVVRIVVHRSSIVKYEIKESRRLEYLNVASLYINFIYEQKKIS